jgi:hypothetical protein
MWLLPKSTFIDILDHAMMCEYCRDVRRTQSHYRPPQEEGKNREEVKMQRADRLRMSYRKQHTCPSLCPELLAPSEVLKRLHKSRCIASSLYRLPLDNC